MLLAAHIRLRNALCRPEEEAFIFPRMVICGIIGWCFAVLSDFVVKYIKYGELKIYGMAFYGGLIGAGLSMFTILRYGRKNTQYSPAQWFDILIPAWIIFHIFGRIGCFLGGCCYGKYTDHVFGVAFPDQEAFGIVHNGLKRYPTQLFEAFGLCIILLYVIKAKNKPRSYLLSYAVLRFGLEFLRGDDRGASVLGLSVAQWISLAICFAVSSRLICKKILSHTKIQQSCNTTLR